MCREWQQKKEKKFLLPDSVYMQALWAVRDYDRLKEITYVEGGAKERLTAIELALEKVPIEYRHDIMENILHHKAYGDYAHENTWKRWKQKFIYYVAINLGLNY